MPKPGDEELTPEEAAEELTAAEAARLLSCHVSTARRYMQDGILPATRFGRRLWKTTRGDVVALKNSRKHGPPGRGRPRRD